MERGKYSKILGVFLGHEGAISKNSCSIYLKMVLEMCKKHA